jgi:hypothetical protein
VIALLLSLPAVPRRALVSGYKRLRPVNHGSCRSALTSRFGVGAGPTLALDRASKLVTLGRIGAAHHRTITDNSG